MTWPSNAPELVQVLLEQTLSKGASDLHLTPTPEGLVAEWRIDGVMQTIVTFPPSIGPNIVSRLKVLSGLLTYETNKPQEGRLRLEGLGRPMRLSTLPTVFGERIVARVMSEDAGELATLSGMGMPVDVARVLERSLAQTSGAVLFVGPSGAGKTTTAYASLRTIREQSAGGRSVVSLEDPVEVIVPGVAQSQANPHAGFDMHAGLRAIVRQDPEVIYVGEIRDSETAHIAFQAAVTGQLVVTTFHANDAATAITRLLDMGAPAYMIRSATRAIVAQRLLRRLCTECRRAATHSNCQACGGIGYRGRVVVAEAVDLTTSTLADSIHPGYDRVQFAKELQDRQVACLRSQAADLVSAGVTDQLEVDRVLGWNERAGA
ncbi:GspE/PulE family protein [Botrimarina hoheduenensis]|uniref:Putative type II secretion system protein E n=1 Tax=Botrimarina hoheduenensis TaxID=2528000 RepID=A0A5C5VSS4_9BACT|nr:GspE/PulE family protein [Botrimarina hoheduenensis]TWT41320.1 putative type II secretion system protein E [Botrimarina hoheduenensis]